MRAIVIAIVFAISTGAVFAQTLQTSAGKVALTRMISGLDQPWAIGFLPGGGYLVTDRDGALLHVKDGVAQKVTGVPKVVASGQGGLLDVMIPRDFAQSREVFLSYSKAMSGGAGTAMAVGKLSSDGGKLTGVRDVFVMNQGSSGGRHFGSRIVEARDGTIFMTIGERGNRPAAQDLALHHGSVIRINRDGSVPADNPFVGHGDARAEVTAQHVFRFIESCLHWLFDDFRRCGG